ncbi:MAG: O-linked N-acetylglucosamine transferase, SPINDLY family protein [Synechococcales cyanobacterium CRU_2_2]|nr:O-linked N-acetylglucosamine transferase, SPINDLY family protein [Synechococcales cyanobacterium CRU_2_2]
MVVQQSNQLASTAEELFSARNYEAAELAYQALIEAQPACLTHHWKLGLSLLLQGQEAEAQMCWMSSLLEGSESELETWTKELAETLEAEAQTQASADDAQNSWLVRQHLREIQPANSQNLLNLIQLCLLLGYPFSDLISGEQGLDRLLSQDAVPFDKELLISTLLLVLQSSPVESETLSLVRLCLGRLDHLHELRDRLVPICIDLAKGYRVEDAISLGELYLSVDQTDLEFLAHLPGWYSTTKNFPKAVGCAKTRIELSPCEIERIFSRHLLIKILLGTGGHWQEAAKEIETNRAALMRVEQFEPQPEVFQVLRLVSTAFFSPYIQDNPALNRHLINHVANLFSQELRKITPPELKEKNRLKHESARVNLARSVQKKLKIGYISYCLRRHSIGWIARWLLKYHDSASVQTYGYLINFDQQDPFQNWYAKQFDTICRVGIDCPDRGIEIAKRISEDDIDILIDLDSITMDFTCEVMVHKPAPIQVTWLGWDASGLPQIDYYIADSYVLPEEAQSYYREKIWRLPDTYVAVDGFEIEVPKLSRASLDIPNDAVIYLTAQGGYKRNPEIIRLQLSVIKAVSNAFLIIKGTGSAEAIQQHFYSIAKEVGVEKEKLIFLPIVASEEEHRANLRIADIVLDTYPYNGATTTLETLWMEIPLVTLVGEQFSARNSYAMLKNVGVEEGIAWTPEEYVAWGVKLGLDAELRKEVIWKLRESKKSAPLWDAKRFAQNMEEAYQQMWSHYLSVPPEE